MLLCDVILYNVYNVGEREREKEKCLLLERHDFQRGLGKPEGFPRSESTVASLRLSRRKPVFSCSNCHRHE